MAMHAAQFNSRNLSQSVTHHIPSCPLAIFTRSLNLFHCRLLLEDDSPPAFISFSPTGVDNLPVFKIEGAGDVMTILEISTELENVLCRGITEEAVEAKVQAEFRQLFGIHEVPFCLPCFPKTDYRYFLFIPLNENFRSPATSLTRCSGELSSGILPAVPPLSNHPTCWLAGSHQDDYHGIMD